MKKKETKKLVKPIAILVVLLIVEVIAMTVCAQVIPPKPVQSIAQDEIQDDPDNVQEPEPQPCEPLRIGGCDCSSNYARQRCQNQNRNCGC